jgi:hypothetical protein
VLHGINLRNNILVTNEKKKTSPVDKICAEYFTELLGQKLPANRAKNIFRIKF